jgi:programmed cell death protein 5
MEENEQTSPEQMQSTEDMKKKILNKVLSKGAIERLGRIRVVKPELASQIEIYLIQLYQAGKLNTIINEEQLKMILEGIGSAKKGFNIIR